MSTESPWMTASPAGYYCSGGTTTAKGRKKFSKRFLAKEVGAGRLKAARVGARGELLFRKEWLDEYLEGLARPVLASARRRTG